MVFDDNNRSYTVSLSRMPMSKQPVWRVGWWVSEKKRKKLNLGDLHNACRRYGIELVELDLTSGSLSEYGHLDALVHKCSDLMLKAEFDHDPASILQCQTLQKYLAKHSHILMLDPLCAVRKLCDRYQQYLLLADVCTSSGICTPRFTVLNSCDQVANAVKVRENGLGFPLVCKPLIAHGSDAHKMALIFNEEGLKDVQPPCVAQMFVPHNAVLYKIYVLGQKWFVQQRPSLKNFKAGDYDTIFFDSQEVSKDGCSSRLTELDETDAILPEPDMVRLEHLVNTLRSNTGLTLVGMDVIIGKHTGTYYVIDTNVFPSYEGCDAFVEDLSEHIFHTLMHARSSQSVPNDFRTLDAAIFPPLAVVAHRRLQTDLFDRIHPRRKLPALRETWAGFESGYSSGGGATESDSSTCFSPLPSDSDSDCCDRLKGLNLANNADKLHVPAGGGYKKFYGIPKRVMAIEAPPPMSALQHPFFEEVKTRSDSTP